MNKDSVFMKTIDNFDFLQGQIQKKEKKRQNKKKKKKKKKKEKKMDEKVYKMNSSGDRPSVQNSKMRRAFAAGKNRGCWKRAIIVRVWSLFQGVGLRGTESLVTAIILCFGYVASRQSQVARMERQVGQTVWQSGQNG